MSEKYHFETINRLQSQISASPSSAPYNHTWRPFKFFLSPGLRPKARGLGKISTSGMGNFFQKVFFKKKSENVSNFKKKMLPK